MGAGIRGSSLRRLNESAVERQVFFTAGAPTSCDRPAAAAPAKWRRWRRSVASAKRKYKISNEVEGDKSFEAMTWLCDCNFPRHSIIFIVHAEFVIVNEVVL